ncbi:glycosyltransferase family 4 protein [Quadrisphaera sp. KR29]|uniref:glycosyltransferase family 4 protein n=1 Tax=Quadrisphaera sp. KR29 TaxID=3461391 RepID=UPI004043EF3E
MSDGSAAAGGGGLRVLRLCSVFGVPDRPLHPGDLRFDAVGGMQNHTGHLTAALDELGVEQVVVTSWPPSHPRREHLWERTTVHRRGWAVPVARQGWAVHATPVLLRAASALRPGRDLVHAHLGEDLAVLPLARRVAAARRVPLVVTVHLSLAHTLPPGGLRRAVLRHGGGALERAAVRDAAGVLVLTERARAAAVADGARPERVHVVPSGVDPVLFAPPTRAEADPLAPTPGAGAHLRAARPRVLFIGRFGAQKGLPVLVRAAALLRTDAEVVLAGSGPDEASLRALVADLGVGHRVRLCGPLDHDLVPAALRTAAVAVQPSTYEEMGTSVVEALAAGTPVVASRTGGIPDLLQQGRCGVLVDPGDEHALARALDDLMADGPRRAELAARGREVGEALAWPSLARRVLGVYREAVASGALERPGSAPVLG